jgi:hypothetical protein
MIFVILGMHKSGTTLVAQILHHSGINMGEDFDSQVSYDEGNKYERETAVALNLNILGVSNFKIIDVPTPKQLDLTPQQRLRMREIVQNCNETYTHWGFKDPRTTLVYPLWRSELPEHKIIAIYRTPEEIWPRFRYRGKRYFMNPYRAWLFMSRWYEHNALILSYLRQTSMNFLLLNYQDLINTDTEFKEIENFVGFKLEDRRNKKLYRNRQTESYFLLKMAGWLVEKQRGCHPNEIQQQLQALHVSQRSTN